MLVSTNSGSSWQGVNVGGGSAACSADGSKMVAAASGMQFPPWYGTISISTNYGFSWTPTAAPRESWSKVICSADGTKLVAASNRGVYTSADSGQSWTSNSVPPGPIACSADATKLILASSYSQYWPSGQIYLSTNSGAVWNLSTNSPNMPFWEGVASSADGMKLVAIAYQVPIYTSSDGGVTWASNAAPSLQWFGVCSSADAPSGSELLISWIIPSARFVLQESTDLRTLTWNDVATQPMLNYTNLNYQVTVPVSSGTRFFRLIAR